MREALDIAYVLLVEEFAGPNLSVAAARQRVDDLLDDPEARARREDQEAMRRLMATSGFLGRKA